MGHKNKTKIRVTIAVVVKLLVIIEIMIFSVQAADESEVSIDPASQNVSPNSEFKVNVSCVPGLPIKAFEFKFSFDASLVQVDSVIEGDIFDGYETYFNSGVINNNEGTVVDVYGLILGQGNVTEEGSFVCINLTSLVNGGVSQLELYDVGVTNETQYIPITVNNGSVQVISILPEISNVDIANSSPLDTDPSFNWVNITCDVSDEDGVDVVYLNITNPDGSYNNVSMMGEDNYYYNSTTAFSDYGNYSYFVWAKDNAGGSVSSSVYYFSMPPNWDIDKNGVIKVYDMTMISNHYNETGGMGWIREDVDNNGIVDLVDLVSVSNHYNEVWWN